MEKFKTFIKAVCTWIGYDGLQHFTTAALIVFSCGWVRPIYVAVIVAGVVSVAKEIYDHFKPQPTRDHLHDIICACAGIVFGLFLVFINSLAR